MYEFPDNSTLLLSDENYSCISQDAITLHSPCFLFAWITDTCFLQILVLEPVRSYRNIHVPLYLIVTNLELDFSTAPITQVFTPETRSVTTSFTETSKKKSGCISTTSTSKASCRKSVSNCVRCILNSFCRCEAISASDYVEFSNFMTRDRKYSRHCGQLKEFDVASDRKFFRVTFRSNDRLDGTGFNATYQFLDEVESYTAKTDKKSGSCRINGKTEINIVRRRTILKLCVVRNCVSRFVKHN